jgi:FMN phosphatase YigB (HAD superfamily)
MSDALSDIRKADRNHLRYSQVEYEAAIKSAEKRGYERALDDLGVLHGEDARKFNEELKNPSPLTPEAAEVMRKARELARS